MYNTKDGVYYFVSNSFNDSSNLVKFFVNGTMTRERELTGNIILNSSDLIISQKFGGEIAQIRLYNRVLDAEEINVIYSSSINQKLGN